MKTKENVTPVVTTVPENPTSSNPNLKKNNKWSTWKELKQM